MNTPRRGPVRVAILNDYEIVVTGVAGLLEPFADRVEVVERDSRLMPVSEVDVVLYDTFGQVQGDALDVGSIRRSTDAKLVVFSWNTDPGLVSRALARGAAGYVAKSATGEELTSALEAVFAGETVTPSPAAGSVATPRGDWPGQEFGLTAREAEVIALITQGLSNQEIADRCFLSINSVKTYIRTAYRKMGTTRRAQAVRWGIEHGFEPDTSRQLG